MVLVVGKVVCVWGGGGEERCFEAVRKQERAGVGVEEEVGRGRSLFSINCKSLVKRGGACFPPYST